MSQEDRAAELESENVELRAEVERLKAQVAMQGTELCSVHEDGKHERDQLADPRTVTLILRLKELLGDVAFASPEACAAIEKGA